MKLFDYQAALTFDSQHFLYYDTSLSTDFSLSSENPISSGISIIQVWGFLLLFWGFWLVGCFEFIFLRKQGEEVFNFGSFLIYFS